jgi:hypothetical protein
MPIKGHFGRTKVYRFYQCRIIPVLEILKRVVMTEATDDVKVHEDDEYFVN